MGAGVGFQVQFTNAVSVESFKGSGIFWGGSITIYGVGISVDFINSSNPDGSPWRGVAITVGPELEAGPLPIEVHGGWSYGFEWTLLTAEQTSNIKNDIQSAIAEIGSLLTIDEKFEINNIIGGNIFMIEL